MSRRRRVQAAPVEESKVTRGVDMQERIEFLKEDLQHLFDSQGIDEAEYDDKVDFMDPITKYDSVKGYAFNIKMLKNVFAPTFQLHDIKQTGEYEITTRWTMVMKPTFNRLLPIKRWWDPNLVFTGVSIMGVNPANGKFNRHVDLWDALKPENQKYLSLEGVSHVFSQLGSLSRAPDLDTPEYTILRKKKDYEIRRYEPFTVAEADMEASTSGRDSGPASDGKGAFNTLAGYIFGKNKQQQKMAMTTPVYTNSGGKMQFVVGTAKGGSQLPEPESDAVRTRALPGGLFAAYRFSGVADDAAAKSKLEALRAALSRDSVNYDSAEWILARYNDPSTRPIFRRNEILVPVGKFDVWDA